MTDLPQADSSFSSSGSAPDAEREALALRIGEVRFPPVRFGTGYDMPAVDGLLDQLVAAARAGADLRPLVDAAVFPVTRGREGYRIDAVDDFLDEVSGGRTTARTATDMPDAPDVPDVPDVPADTPQTGVGAEPQGPGIIPPRRGFLARLLGRS